MSQATEIIKALLAVIDQAKFDGMGVTGAEQLSGIVRASYEFVQAEEAPQQEELDLQEELNLDE